MEVSFGDDGSLTVKFLPSDIDGTPPPKNRTELNDVTEDNLRIIHAIFAKALMDRLAVPDTSDEPRSRKPQVIQGYVFCEDPDCFKMADVRHRWSRNPGWFLMKNGKAYCPQHIPEWVESWRANKEKTR